MQVKMNDRAFQECSVLLTRFELALDNLQHLNEILPKLYLEYVEKESEKLKEIKIEPQTDFKIMREVIEIFQNTDVLQEDKLKKLSQSSKKIFQDELERYAKKIQTEPFLRNMSVTHLVITFEEFLGKTLKLTFLNNSDMLKSDTKLRFETIIDLKNYESILNTMIEQKVREIIKKDIHELGEYLLSFFKFSMIDHSDWKKFTEVFYRRNVIVHNQGISDKEYEKHTGNPINEDLTPNEDYIKESLILFRNYAKNTTSFFLKKYFSPKE